jgi:flavin reductase (DIM6/NTAB) family NADH-FMN oxidoreductase RutF
MAAAAVRYLRSTGAGTTAAGVEALPRPELRAVGDNERPPLDAGEFRRVLGQFASGVTVITAPAAAEDRDGSGRGTAAGTGPGAGAGPLARSGAEPGTGPGPAGFACQSFSSLSLDPPLVAFMVGRSSSTWPRIARAGVFCVNVLGAGQAGLCRGFAVSGAGGGDKFEGVAYDAAPATGSPRLSGAAAWIDCVIHAVHTGGDHLIVVGRVAALGADPAAEPLVFHRGTFGGFEGFPL